MVERQVYGIPRDAAQNLMRLCKDSGKKVQKWGWWDGALQCCQALVRDEAISDALEAGKG